jgi:hypothetical protein
MVLRHAEVTSAATCDRNRVTIERAHYEISAKRHLLMFEMSSDGRLDSLSCTVTVRSDAECRTGTTSIHVQMLDVARSSLIIKVKINMKVVLKKQEEGFRVSVDVDKMMVSMCRDDVMMM